MGSTAHPSIGSHPAFAPFCSLWLGVLLGASVWMVWEPLSLADTAAFGQGITACLAAVGGGVLGYAMARAAKPARTGQRPPLEGPVTNPHGEKTILDFNVLEISQEAGSCASTQPLEAREGSFDPLDIPPRLRSPLDSRALAELGTIELLERLAAALHRRAATRQ